jgi:hypothetical protein
VTWHNAAVLGCGVTAVMPYRYMGVVDPYDRERCSRSAKTWRHRVKSRPADVVAVLVGRWEVADQHFAGRWTHVGEPALDGYLTKRLNEGLDAASVTGAGVVLLTAPYYSRGEQPDGSTWPEDDPARVDAFNRLLRRVAAARAGVHVVEFGRRMAGGADGYVNDIDGVRLRYDGVHFTLGAAAWIQPWLEAQLARAMTTAEPGERQGGPGPNSQKAP